MGKSISALIALTALAVVEHNGVKYGPGQDAGIHFEATDAEFAALRQVGAAKVREEGDEDAASTLAAERAREAEARADTQARAAADALAEAREATQAAADARADAEAAANAAAEAQAKADAEAKDVADARAKLDADIKAFEDAKAAAAKAAAKKS